MQHSLTRWRTEQMVNLQGCKGLPGRWPSTWELMEPRTGKLLSTFTGDTSQLNCKGLSQNAVNSKNESQDWWQCLHRWGIEQAAEIAVGGNLMLELLKEFVGRLMPNDRKVNFTDSMFMIARTWPLIILYDYGQSEKYPNWTPLIYIEKRIGC